jgi:hypothetical protein
MVLRQNTGWHENTHLEVPNGNASLRKVAEAKQWQNHVNAEKLWAGSKLTARSPLGTNLGHGRAAAGQWATAATGAR